MAMNEQPTVESVFELHSQADAAMYELQQAGFNNEQIRLIDASSRTIVMVQAADRQQEATSILHRNGGYEADPRFVQVQAGEPLANDPATVETTAQATNTNASSHHYDPIKGVIQDNEVAPVSPGGYGLKRDPSVETDATAGTLDQQTRPNPALTDGSNDSIFERPISPGTVQPGDINDPNDRGPRIP